MLTEIYCPNCGKSARTDTGKEACFCRYCGTEIKTSGSPGSASYGNTDNISDLVIKAKKAYSFGRFDECEDLLNKILQIDRSNEYARKIKGWLQTKTIKPNLLVEYEGVPPFSPTMTISIDSSQWITVAHGTPVRFKLGFGRHNIMVRSSRKTYIRTVNIIDKRTYIRFKWTLGGGSTNSINIDYIGR